MNCGSRVSQAWDVYYNVYNRITDLLKYSMSIDLHEASPKLFGM
jgi:hypothetical protein